MGMFPFGSGAFYFQNARAGNYTKYGVAALQEGSVNIEMDVKELHGGNRFAVDVRTGKGKIDGSVKFADWRSDAFALVTGASVATGQRSVVIDESGTLATHAVTVSGSATFYRDVQVTFIDKGAGTSTLTAGQILTQVASAPTAGQYSVAAGVYTFAVADDLANVKISYMKTLTTGALATWSNVAIGTTPVFRGLFQGTHDADRMVLELEYCVIHGWKTGSKIDDWMQVDVPFKAFADPVTTTIGYLSLPQ